MNIHNIGTSFVCERTIPFAFACVPLCVRACVFSSCFTIVVSLNQISFSRANVKVAPADLHIAEYNVLP